MTDGAWRLPDPWPPAGWRPAWWGGREAAGWRARLRSPALRRERLTLAGVGTVALAVVAVISHAVTPPVTVPVMNAGYVTAGGAPVFEALPAPDGFAPPVDGLEWDPISELPPGTAPVAGQGLTVDGSVLRTLPKVGRARESKGTGMGAAAGRPCLGRVTSGFRNGEIPRSALCPVRGAPGHLLRADAARAFDRLTSAYARRFGTTICVTDSYRDRPAQVALRARKPTLAAIPGTSMHGLGIAVDLCGGVQRFDSPQHRWLRQNAPAYGWQHPSWARVDGSRPEAWHWEFDG